MVSDQSGSIKITAWGSASQGKNDTVFLDKLVVGNTYMLMNFEWTRDRLNTVGSQEYGEVFILLLIPDMQWKYGMLERNRSYSYFLVFDSTNKTLHNISQQGQTWPRRLAAQYCLGGTTTVTSRCYNLFSSILSSNIWKLGTCNLFQ